MKSHASMNRLYRLVWNAALNIWVAVAENAKGRGKGGSSRSRVDVASTSAGGTGLASAGLATLSLLGACALLLTSPTQAGPTGGQVVAGSGVISQSANATTITQASSRLALDWSTFSTRANESITFVQPNAQAIALNRITGTSPSSLLGSLSANGQVFVLNPNGVMFGAGSQVNVGGLVASTLSLGNADFMAGKNTFTQSAGSTSASVVNQGTLTAASGGYIALLAPEVRNEGVISATLGTALLAAGNQVTLNLNNGSLLSYSIDQGALNALADNKQLIQADGGQVILSAKALDALSHASVNNSGIIEARTLQNKAGRILLMGDMAVGTVTLSGKLDASAPNTDGQGGLGGNGGFIETSAAHVQVADSAVVTTLAAPNGTGKSGTWLIDPTDYTIAATNPGNGSSYMSNTALSTNLGNGNVSIQTLATGTGNGDIFVNDSVSWTSGNSLTLNAIRDVNVNAAITSGSFADRALGGNVSIAAGRDILLGVTGTAINTSVAASNSWATRQGGDIALTAGGKIAGANSGLNSSITKYQGGSIGSRGGNITLTANGGDVTIAGMSTSTYQNDTGGAIGNGGNVNVTAKGAITVGGINTTSSGAIYNYGNATTMGNGGNVSLIAMSGSVTVNGAIDASVSRNNATGGVGGSIILRADGKGACQYNITVCSTVVFGAGGNVKTTDTGRTDIYYNPVTYTTANPYTAKITGTSTAWMLINDVGVAAGGTRGLQAVATNLAGNYALGSNVDASGTATWNSRAGFTPIGNSNTAFTGTFDGLGHTVSNLTINAPNTDKVGLFGQTGTGTVIQNVGLAGSNVTGKAFVGSLVGYNYASINNSYAMGSVTGTDNTAGGLVGSNNGTITNSYATGSVSAIAYGRPVTPAFTGGLTGVNSGSISNSYSTSSVNGWYYLGGLVGYNPEGGTISNSYATGSVRQITDSGAYIGGLTGVNSGSISNSYTTGLVNGNYYVGGLSGYNNPNGTIINSYATGNVSLRGANSGEMGGLIGHNDAPSAVQNSFWNTDTSGTTGSAGGVGLTTAQMQTASNFAGFNFTTTPGAAGNNWVMVNVDGSLNNTGGAVGATRPMLASEYSTTINNAHQLQLMAMAPSASYIVGSNVDASATATASDVWVNASGRAGFVPVGNSSTAFTGTFDGLSHTISKLTINASSTNYVGLFGQAGTGAVLQNVGLVGGSVVGADYVGGLVGQNAGALINTSNTGAVTGNNNVGGLVGANIGGAGGDSNNQLGSTASIASSYATGAVSGMSDVGGLVGKNAGGDGGASVYQNGGGRGGVGGVASIHDSYATGVVTGSLTGNNIGGMVGVNIGGHGGGTNNWGTVAGAGGIATISSSYATGAVSGNGYVGGLVGENMGGGGGTGYMGVGGDGASASVTNSYATGNVAGYASVGGLVGGNIGGAGDWSYLTSAPGNGGSATISNSYSVGSAGGSRLVGGLVGETRTGSTMLIGSAQGAGGLSNISNSYWNTNTSGQIVSNGGTGLITAQMESQASFTPTWDFSNTWVMYEGHTSPLLRSFMTPLTVTGNSVTKVYDGNAYTGSVSGVTYSSTPNSNLFVDNLSYGGSSQGAKNAGIYNVTPTGLYSNQQGYIISYVSGGLTITPKTLSATATAMNKIYDGSTAATAPMLTISSAGFVNNETVTATAIGSFNFKDVATANLVTVNSITLANGTNGGLASNYSLATGETASANITAKALSATASAFNKTYDGSTAATPMLTISSAGFVNNETVTATATGSFNFKDVATANLVTVNSITMANGTNGGLASNYSLTTGEVASANITAKALSATASAANKTYDGTTTSAPMLTISSTGLINGETVIATATGSFNTKDVLTANLVTVNSTTLANGTNGGLASNYSLASGETAAANITAKALSATASAFNKTYDGSTAATSAPMLTISSAGFINSETVTATATGSFNTKDVLTANLVTVNSTTLVNGVNGGKASNYSLASGETASANITTKALSATASASNKTYDGSTAAAPMLTIASTGFINGETVTATATGSFNTKDVLTANLVTVNSTTLVNGVNGGKASNYSLASGETASANITAKALSATASASIKTYDGSTAAAPMLTIASTGFINSETVTATATGSFNTKDVATANRVTVNSTTLANGTNGGLASNYSLASGQTAAANVMINPATLTVTANTATRLYGAANPTLTGSVTGFVNGETLATATTGTEAFSSTASSASNVGAYAITGTGLTANNGNYVFTPAAANSTALTLTKAPLTVTANDASRLADGSAYAGGNGVVYNGFVVGDTSAVLAASVQYAGSAQGASAAGRYVITPLGQSASNYALAFVDGALTIKPGNAAESALGGPTLVAAYNSALHEAASPAPAAGVKNDSNSSGNALTSSNANTGSGTASPGSNQSLVSLQGCGVSLPAGVSCN